MSVFILQAADSYTDTDVLGVYKTFEEASAEALRRLYEPEALGRWSVVYLDVYEWEPSGKCLAVHEYRRRHGEDPYSERAFRKTGYELIRTWPNAEKAWYKCTKKE